MISQINIVALLMISLLKFNLICRYLLISLYNFETNLFYKKKYIGKIPKKQSSIYGT